MGLTPDYNGGQTSLDQDEMQELLIPTITSRVELDEFEQQNIESAVQWTISRSFKAGEVLSENFIKLLHARMYGDVWKWAGEFRKSNKNIGVDKYMIAPELRNLTGDCLYWINNQTFADDEIAIRFKHRLVSIHCFPNGNGRHARLMADVLVWKVLGHPAFSWGSASRFNAGEARAAYISALRRADDGDIQPLLVFARS
ncbi:MAG: mobile mystery protein B [Ignavibacteria bacterium]|nr:mobile mystery protein B [Ignavibacteria bacterium]